MSAEPNEPVSVGNALQTIFARLQYETLKPPPPDGFEGIIEEDGTTYAIINGSRLQVRPRPQFTSSLALCAWGNRALPWLTEEEYQNALTEYNRLDRKEKSEARNRAPALQAPTRAFTLAWEESVSQFSPRHKSGEMSLEQFQKALAGVVVEHLQVPLGPRSVNRVMDVFQKHGSRATREGVISLLQENAPIDKRLQWLEYRAKTSKMNNNSGNGERQ